MKIYSWNMLYRNQELDRAFDFISKSDFDIFCLQEVPEEMLARLKALPFHIASRIDTEKLSPAGSTPMYVVILSRYPIEKQGEIAFDDYRSLLPLRTRFFIRCMPNKFFTKICNRGCVYADITVEGILFRIFCLHLVLAQPAWRLAEFERAMTNRDETRQTIVCGDFNILEAPHITPLNWILGGTLSDMFLYKRERTTIEKQFATYGLTNVLRGKVTHSISHSQLDHILVPRASTIQKAAVLSDCVGSDHHPICVEIV